MDLKTQDYENAASSTVPPIVHTEAVRPAVIFHLLTEFAKAGSNLDKYLKKPLVYGPTRVTEEHVAQFVGLADIDPPRDLTDEEAMFAHGVVGVATEAGELVEALLKVWFFKEPWDRPNVMEEGGDVLWYVVRFLKAAGYTLPEAMERNILKLTNRHHRNGATFNPDADRNRDLEAERALLEAPPAARAIVEGAAAQPPQEPYLGLATNAQLRAEMEARESLGHTADNYRTTDGSPASEQRGMACLQRFDDGREVWLDSYSGGGSPEGVFGKLRLATYQEASQTTFATTRDYVAVDLVIPENVVLESVHRVGNAEVRHRIYGSATLDDNARTVFYPISGNPLAINGQGGPMRDATADELETLPVDRATFVTGDPSRVSTSAGQNQTVIERQDMGGGVVMERRAVDRPATEEEAASLYPEKPYRGPGSFYAEHGRDKHQDFDAKPIHGTD